MPTGYTDPIKNGITFEQYALGCARAFGALVHMRDEPSNAEIPERIEPSDFYQKHMEKAHATLDRIRAWTPADVEREYRADRADGVAAHAKRCSDRADLRAKYEAMLAQVRAWTPPTPDHVHFREFMEEQIVKSIDFDCDEGYDTAPPDLGAQVWHAQWIADLRDSIARYENQHREEVQRAHSRTEWIKALRQTFAEK